MCLKNGSKLTLLAGMGFSNSLSTAGNDWFPCRRTHASHTLLWNEMKGYEKKRQSSFWTFAKGFMGAWACRSAWSPLLLVEGSFIWMVATIQMDDCEEIWELLRQCLMIQGEDGLPETWDEWQSHQFHRKHQVPKLTADMPFASLISLFETHHQGLCYLSCAVISVGCLQEILETAGCNLVCQARSGDGRIQEELICPSKRAHFCLD